MEDELSKLSYLDIYHRLELKKKVNERVNSFYFITIFFLSEQHEIHTVFPHIVAAATILF